MWHIKTESDRCTEHHDLDYLKKCGPHNAFFFFFARGVWKAKESFAKFRGALTLKMIRLDDLVPGEHCEEITKNPKTERYTLYETPCSGLSFRVCCFCIFEF